MKIAHLADLHLGKTLSHLSFIDEQISILNKIVHILEKEKIDVLLIAGDIYDRPIPSAEATKLLSTFLGKLHKKNIKVIMIAGNHDSADRLEYASNLLNEMDLYIRGNYEGKIEPIIFEDEYGSVNFFPIPYIRPSMINRYIEQEEEKVHSYDEAFTYLMKQLKINKKERNIVLSHQFVTGAQIDPNSSEELIVGGLDEISAKHFEIFDYTALGHIHRPQKVQKETIRYAGTPLKYSFGEASQTKTLPIITLKEKGNIEIEYIPLEPKRDLIELKMEYKELLKKEVIEQYKDHYLHIVLKDKDLIEDASRVLRIQYPYLLKLDYEHIFSSEIYNPITLEERETKTPFELFSEFYELRNGEKMSSEQESYLQKVLEELEGGMES